MARFNTGNPVDSKDPRDLSDNAQNIDQWANSEAASFPDRLGVARRTLRGMDGEFQSFLDGSAFDFSLGDYAAGIEVASRNQVIREAGEFWRVAASTELPYTTNGAGMPEGGSFVSVGDAVLRQDLAASTTGQGSDLIAHTGATDTVTQALDKRTIYVKSVAELVGITAPINGAHYSVTGYHPSSDIGGGQFYWDSSRSKTEHNGGTVVDPDKTFPDDWSILADVENWFSAPLSGAGCFVRRFDFAVDPFMFGAFATGDQYEDGYNDRSIIQQMLNLVSEGQRVFDFKYKHFYLGAINRPDYPAIFEFDQIDGLRIIGRGQFYVKNEFTANTILTETLFKFTDCSDFEVHADAYADVYAIDQPQPDGIITVEVFCKNVNASHGRAFCGVSNGVAAIQGWTDWGIARARTPADPIFRDFKYEAWADTAKYGFRNIEGINDAQGTINTRKVTRSFFPVGCENHICTINSREQIFANDVLIKAYNNDVRNIFVTLNQIGSTSQFAACRIEHQNDTDNTIIENVKVNINSDKTDDFLAVVGQYRLFNGDIQAETNCLTRNCEVQILSDFPDGIQSIDFPTKQLIPSIFRTNIASPLVFGSGTNGFTVMQGGLLKSMKKGDLSETSIHPCRVKISESSTQGMARVTYSITDDFVATSISNRRFGQSNVAFTIRSDLTGTIDNLDNVSSYLEGTVGFTFSIADGCLQLNSNLTGDNPVASMVVDFVSLRHA